MAVSASRELTKIYRNVVIVCKISIFTLFSICDVRYDCVMIFSDGHSGWVQRICDFFLGWLHKYFVPRDDYLFTHLGGVVQNATR